MSETCTRYSSSCTGDAAVADVTAEFAGNVDKHTLCPTCIAGLAWTLYDRNEDAYARDAATVEITELVGEEDENEVRELVRTELAREFAYGNITTDDVMPLLTWSV